MVWGYLSNGLMGIVLVITIAFALPDLETALADQSGYPFLYAFGTAISTAGTLVLSCGLLILIFASNVGYLTGAARETYAFARDNGRCSCLVDPTGTDTLLIGLPFSGWIATVHPTLGVPANALLLTSAIAVLLALLNIGSAAAFGAIISLNTVAIMLTYALSIVCVLHRRLTAPHTLPPARFSLGRAGVAVNITAVTYATWALFWAAWPETYPVDAGSFNWAAVIFAAVTLLSAGMYAWKGRKIYTGPAALVSNAAPTYPKGDE
jgi:choline transport protein